MTTKPTIRKRPDFDPILACATGIQQRLAALGIKGPAKTADAAIHYAVGYTMALKHADLDTSALHAWIAFDLAIDAKRALARTLEDYS